MAVLDHVRKFNKRVLNPLMLRMAGSKHWYAAVVEHTGRRSGKQYATPVAAEQTPDGFIIPLPYGVGVDWLRNVLAAGHATIRADGPKLPGGATRDHRRTSSSTTASVRAAARVWPFRRRELSQGEVGADLNTRPR